MEREEKNKFSIIRSGQEQQVKLKAESQAEAEEWMKNILAAISLVCFTFPKPALNLTM